MQHGRAPVSYTHLKMAVPTPHIAAAKDQIAKTVLMPGDPLRAKFIAENLLTDPELVNNVRGVQGLSLIHI